MMDQSKNKNRRKAQNQVKWIIKRIRLYTSTYPSNPHDGLLPSYPTVWLADHDMRYKYTLSEIGYHKLISYYTFIAWEELRQIYTNIMLTLHVGGDNDDAQTVINSLRQLVLIIDPNFDANNRSSIDALTDILSTIFSEYRIDPARDVVWNKSRNIYTLKKPKLERGKFMKFEKRQGDIAATAIATANRHLAECEANMARWKELASNSQVRAENLAVELDAVNSQHSTLVKNNEILTSKMHENERLITEFVAGLISIGAIQEAPPTTKQLIRQYENVLRDYAEMRARMGDMERQVEMERQLGRYIKQTFSSDLTDMVRDVPTILDLSPVEQARLFLERYNDRYSRITNDSMNSLNGVFLQSKRSPPLISTDPLKIPDGIRTVGTIIHTYAGNLVHMFRTMIFFQKLLALIRAYPELVTRIKIPAFSESAKELANTLRYFYDENQIDGIINQMHTSEYLSDYFDKTSDLELPNGDLVPESLESILPPAATMITDTALVMRKLHAAPIAFDAMPFTVEDVPLVVFSSTTHAHWSLNSYPSSTIAGTDTALVQRSRVRQKCRDCIGCMTKMRPVRRRHSRLASNYYENEEEKSLVVKRGQRLLEASASDDTSPADATATTTDWQTKYVQYVERANSIESSLRAELEEINTNRVLPLETRVQVLTKQLNASQQRVDELNHEVNKHYSDADEVVQDQERRYRIKYDELVKENTQQSERIFILEALLKEASETIDSGKEDFALFANQSQQTIDKLKENIKSLTNDVTDCRLQKTQLESEISAIIESPSKASEIITKLIKLKRLPHLGKRLRVDIDSE